MPEEIKKKPEHPPFEGVHADIFKSRIKAKKEQVEVLEDGKAMLSSAGSTRTSAAYQSKIDNLRKEIGTEEKRLEVYKETRSLSKALEVE